MACRGFLKEEENGNARNKNMKTQLTRVNVLKVSKGHEAFKNSLKFCSVTVFAVCFSLNFKNYFTPIK